MMGSKMHREKFSLTKMIPSDQWYIEKNKAWFLSIISNNLFEVDMECNFITMLDTVPEHAEWRMLTYCFKYKSFIYCLPDFGQYIWKYNLCDSSWKKIRPPLLGTMRYSIEKYWILDEKVLILSGQTKTIWHLSLKNDVITKCDYISQEKEDTFRSAERVGNNIYIVSNTLPVLYIYNILTGLVKKFTLPNMTRGAASMAHMDGFLWLSGYEHCLWRLKLADMRSSIIPLPGSIIAYNFLDLSRSLENNTKNAGVYALFGKILNLCDTLWLIPEIASEILYVEKDGNLKEFEIFDEDETVFTAKHRCLNIKYIVLYTREDRYIGIFSYKNEHIIEIDTLNKKYIIKDFFIDTIPFEAYRPNETNARSVQWLINSMLCSVISKSNKPTISRNITVGERILSKLLHM